MKKWKKLLLTVVPMTLALSFTSMAGQWNNDMNGWWYTEDDGSYLTNGWYWLDGNNDGIEECYYFDKDGYMVNDHGYVDGYQVDENGAWIVDGKVQRRKAQAPAAEQSVPVAENSDAMAAYLAAQEKNSALDSMDTDVNYVMSVSTQGVTIDAKMNLNMKMKNVTGENIQFVTNGSMTMLGTEIPVNMFYTDGYFYMDMMGTKAKQAMPMDKAIAEASGNTEIDTSLMRDMQMRKEGENTILTYTVDAAVMNGYMESILGSNPALSNSQAQISYNIRSSNGEAVINKDGYYTSQKVYVDMDMTMVDMSVGEAETINMKMDMTMTINNPGQPVDFAIPSTEGYEDMSTMQ